MNTSTDTLHTFLTPLTSQWTEIADWPLARFAVSGYQCDQLPPAAFITSVRAIVLRQTSELRTEVLVVQDPERYHIIPGGRRAAGETLTATAAREVLEETGWQVTIGDLLGFAHFQRLTPLPPGVEFTGTEFVQLVYSATAERYHAEGREEDGYEIGATFVDIAKLDEYNVTPGERLLLKAALEKRIL
ncbi:MAG TPA: NUDIX hydrolase [Caldilineaceae bacterium]|nr:NUDIX hydrolase [Caldilineaceae bacterium]